MQIKPYKLLILASSLACSQVMADSTTPSAPPPPAAGAASNSAQISIAPSSNQLTMARSLFKDSDYQHLQNDPNVVTTLTPDM